MEPDVRVPSGLEVESARLNTPAIEFEPPLHEHGGLRSRVAGTVSGWTSRGGAQLTRWRSTVTAKSHDAKSAVAGVGPKLQSQLRSDPKKWAGIAAGAGVALGLAGRYLRHRAHVNARRPQVVVIEASC
jgi:hypothetical protein